MTDYLKQTLKTDLALTFAESFSSSSKDNYFLFLGKITQWDDEENPPTPIDSLSEELSAWRDMMALAKITKNNIAVGVVRYNWEYNKVFDQFDDTIDLYEEGNERQFYCITDEYNVYKCISNNFGAKSLYKPTLITPEEQIMEDGYVWKFMFKVREELYEFLTNEFIPIEKLESIIYNDERSLQNNVRLSAVPSSIENIVVTQFGSAYPLSVIQDPSDTDAKHQITEVIDSTTFKLSYYSDISKTNNIYNDYYELYIAEGPGSGSKSTITSYIVEDNEITVTVADKLNFVTTDSVYRIYPKVEIKGDGTDAKAIPIMNSDKLITGFSIINSGKNYHYATLKVYRVNETYSSVTLARPILSPINGHGFDAIKELGANCVLIHVPLRNSEKITQSNAVNILKNDYRQVGILKNAFYNNLLLEPIISEDNLKSFIEIENINSKSYIYLETSDDILVKNTNAAIGLEVGSILKQGSETNNFQARGIVESIEIVSSTGGFNYIIIVTNTNGRFLSSESSTYSLVHETNDGDIPISGNITGVIVTNLYDENTFQANKFIIGTITNSTAKITKWECNPYGLSGQLYIDDIKGEFGNSYYTKDSSNNIVLVKGENIIQYSGIDSQTGQFIDTSNKSIGIIKSYGTNENINKTFYKVSTTLNIVPSTGILLSDLFNVDDIVTNGNGVQGKVISYSFNDVNSATLEVNGLTGNFSVNDNLYILNTTETLTNSKINSIVQPEVLPYYGDIIYIQNVIPVTASNDAEEHIKVLIKF